MSGEFVLSISTKEIPKQNNPIHLVMWEGSDVSSTQQLMDRITQLEKEITKLKDERQTSIFFPPALHPTPRGIEVKSRSDSFVNELDTLNVLKSLSLKETIPELKLDTSTIFPNMDLCEEEDAGEEAGEAEEAGEEAAEDEVDEFQELVWKDVIYYKDSQNMVYELDGDGDLIDTPIGFWKEETKKLVKYKTV
jgi:hypothetical protein